VSGARIQAHEIEELIDGFLSARAHELRTPLSVIVGYAELLRTRDDPDTRREATQYIEEAARRLLATIDDLLRNAALRAEAACAGVEPS
jgi:signal transduction histidine kinase